MNFGVFGTKICNREVFTRKSSTVYNAYLTESTKKKFIAR